MTRGILFVVFGDYYKLAIQTITYSRQFTTLPIQIIHNIKELPDYLKINNTIFTYSNLNTEFNRQIKTLMHLHSVFDETIYIDCDAVIQNYGIEDVFKYFDEGNDLLLVNYGFYRTSDIVRRQSPYTNIFKKFNIESPVCIYYGAFIGFKKNDKVSDFFTKWNKNWKEDGCGREMPALSMTTYYTNAVIKNIEIKDNIFMWKPYNPKSIIQHEFGGGSAFWKKYFNFNKNLIEIKNKVELIEEINKNKIEPIKDINKNKIEPIKDINKNKIELVKDINKNKVEPIKDINENKIELVKNVNENKIDSKIDFKVDYKKDINIKSKNVFIDCGSFKGGISRTFKLKNLKYKVFAFECNPFLSLALYRNNIIKINKAVWIYNGFVDYYLSSIKLENLKNSSLYKYNRSINLDKIKVYQVPCIDFSNWLGNNFTKDDNVIVRMNIAGAEYEVLKKCINDGTINLIKKLLVRWNYNKIDSIKYLHNEVFNKLIDLKINIINKYTELYIDN
jgi:FkbM family methyltransferase